MVERLKLGPASVSELAEPLTMSLAAVVQHVQVLESSGLIKTEKVGRTRTCRIERATISVAEQWITERRRSWEVRLDRLGDVPDGPVYISESRFHDIVPDQRILYTYEMYAEEARISVSLPPREKRNACAPEFARRQFARRRLVNASLGWFLRDRGLRLSPYPGINGRAGEINSPGSR
jgi:DNA-binding Lrp family transcriptional regulator